MKKKIFAVAMAACITALTGCTSGGGSQNGGKTIPTGMPDYSAYETQKVMWIGGWNPPPPKHITSEYDETYDFQTLERYREMADCGINVGLCVYEEKTNYPEEFYLLPVKHEELETPCKAFLYSDPFLGLLDDLAEEEGKIAYGEYAEKLTKAAGVAGKYGYIFTALSSLCRVLELKYNLGVRIRKAYKAGDRAEIADICCDVSEVIIRLKMFYKDYRNLWYTENKPFGFEIQDARLGGLLMRLESCKDRLESYVKGEIETIDELETPILPYRDNPTLYFSIYRRLISPSEI